MFQTNSFYAFVAITYKIVQSQETEEVLHALKHSIEVYERAVTFDISHPGKSSHLN